MTKRRRTRARDEGKPEDLMRAVQKSYAAFLCCPSDVEASTTLVKCLRAQARGARENDDVRKSTLLLLEAFLVADIAVTRRPKSPSLLVSLAVVLADMGMSSEGIIFAERALTHSSETKDKGYVLQTLVRLYGETKNTEAKREARSQLYQINSQKVELIRLLDKRVNPPPRLSTNLKQTGMWKISTRLPCKTFGS